MISKLVKIISTAGMLAVFGFANNSYSADATGTSGLTPGMIAGIGGDIGFAINENTDTKFTPNGTDFATFSAKKDTSYGVYGIVGYMMENGIEGALEVGYRQFKQKDKVSESTFKSKQMFGMIRGTYYLDMQTMVYPYLMAGIGLARSDISASLVKDAGNAATDVATIDSLKVNKFAYQAGVGISTVMQSAILSVGYKYFGIAQIDDKDSSTDAVYTDFAGAAPADLTKVKFGKISQNIHTVEANVKLVF